MAPIIYSPMTTPVEEKTFENTPSCGHKQLPTSSPPEHDYIQASPYTEQDHLLDLNALTKPHRIMAQALTLMQPLSEQYATTAYKEAFNWQDVVDKLQKLSEAEGADYVFPETSFYVIVFRSKALPGAHRPKLGALDKEAHREAVESGWLLKYWFGTPNQEGRNLATCLWRHIDDAKRGGAGPGHAKAMQEVRGFYLGWRVERLKFVVGEGAKGWNIVNWEEGSSELTQSSIWGWIRRLRHMMGF